MMREEDLIRIAKKLDKMVSTNNTDGALDLLKELKSFNMTLKLLQETRIGMSVNGIRKHCIDEEVVTLAKLLIKDWKRLLDAQSPNDMKNGVEAGKQPGSPVHSPSERDHSHRRSEMEPRSDSEPDMKEPDKPGRETRDDDHKKHKQTGGERKGERPSTLQHQNDWPLETSRAGKNPQEPRKERHAAGKKKGRDPEDTEKERRGEEPRKERRGEEPRKERHIQDDRNDRHEQEVKAARLSEERKKERCPEESRKQRGPGEDERGRERRAQPCRAERRSHEPPGAKAANSPKFVFERRSVLDGNILYPSRYPSPPRPPRPPRPLPAVKRPSVEVTRERKNSTDSLPSSRPQGPAPLKSTSPPPRRPSLEAKKERKKAPDPNSPLSPPHLHPPPKPSSVPEIRKERKAPPDPNAPLAPLPLHLHPPPLIKRPSVDGKKDRKETSESRPVSQKRPCDLGKNDRKNSSESKAPKLSSGEVKRERNDSSECKAQVPKRSIVDGRKDKDRKDSSDSKPGHPVKRHSLDSKLDRRESTDSKKAGSPSAKKLSGDRRESHGSKSSPSATLQRKASTDSIERRVKPDTPKTPTTPTSPMSPSFSSAGGPLSPRLATGDSVRDKCIEMLTAALRTDDNYKEFGTNCEAMAAEIEDHIYQENRATDMKYKNRVRSRISNLKDPKNPGLRRNVLAGGIELSRFAVMTAEEMASDELKQLRNVLTQEAIREHQMAKTGGTTTDLLQCGKCRKKNCSYNQVQTRSADEPMTTFVLCNECGNRWKFC